MSFSSALSRVSVMYSANLPVSCMGHQNSQDWDKIDLFCALVWKPKFLQHSKKWFLAELYIFLITGWSVLHVRLHDLCNGITYSFGIIIPFFTDDQFVSSGRSSQRLSFVDDPLSNQRLSFVSVDGSEIDSDYSSASSVVPASSEEQKNLE